VNSSVRVVGVLGLLHYFYAAASYACTTNMGDVGWMQCPIGAIVFGFPIIFLIAAGRESGDWPAWVPYGLLILNSAALTLLGMALVRWHGRTRAR
jgi:hypothetical protein